MTKKICLVFLMVIMVLSFTACKSSEKMFTKASDFREAKMWDEAVNVYKEIIEKYQTEAEAYLGLAEVYRSMNKKDLEEDTLKDGIDSVEDNAPLKMALVNFYFSRVGSTPAMELLIEILEEDKGNVEAYERLMSFYGSTSRRKESIELYEKHKDKVTSHLGAILASLSYLYLEEVEEAKNLISTIDLSKIRDSKSLENLADFYIQTENTEDAILVSKKGLKSENPAIFHGLLYGLTNDQGLKLEDMTTQDVSGDYMVENILLMGDGDSSKDSEHLDLLIQSGETGKIIESLSLNIGGSRSWLLLDDIDGDWIPEIFINVYNSNIDGGIGLYGYSYKDNKLVNILEGFNPHIGMEILDGFKAEIYTENYKDAYIIEFDKERQDLFTKNKNYTHKGLLISSDLGYIKTESLRPAYITGLERHGIEQKAVILPSHKGGVIIANISAVYLFEKGKWICHSFEVSDDNNKVFPIPYVEKKKESIIDQDMKWLKTVFSMNRAEVQQVFGKLTPLDHTAGEFAVYKKREINVFYDEVSSMLLGSGANIFGIDLPAKRKDIIDTLGNPASEGVDEMDGGHILAYELGGLKFLFMGESKEGKFHLFINFY